MMSEDLTQYSTWYVAFMAAGAVVAAPVGATGNAPYFLTGIGLVVLGAGEFINHPYQELHVPGWKASGRIRRWRAPGIVLDIVGIALFAYGLWRIIS